MADLNVQFDEQKRSMEKFVEDEREERNSQYDDMIGRVDKEKRERAKAVDDLEARVEEGVKRVSGRCDDVEGEGKRQVGCRDVKVPAAKSIPEPDFKPFLKYRGSSSSSFYN